jgi:hypothetical protein
MRARNKWLIILLVAFLIGIFLAGWSIKYPGNWIFFEKVRELGTKIGDALIIAVVSAILVDRYVRSELVEEVARDVIPYGVGMGLPPEFARELRTIFRAGITRRDLRISYKLQRVPGRPYVKNLAGVSFLLENNTSQTQKFLHAVRLSESPFQAKGEPDSEIRQFACWKDGKYQYNLRTGDPAFKPTKEKGIWTISREVSVPPQKDAAIRCEAEWTEYYWENYADQFTLASPTVGVTFEIEFPYAEIDVLDVSFQKEADPDQIKEDGTTPGVKTWSYTGVMLTGQHLWIRWERRAVAALPEAIQTP